MAVLHKVVSLFRCCSGSGDANGDQYLQPLNLFHPQNVVSVEDLVEQSAAARERLWNRLGTLEPFALSQAAATGAAALSEPRWPALRQNFRVIHRPNGNVLLVSDGLSDPFDDIHEGGGNVNGYSLEFYIETPASELAGGSSNVADIKRSWQFQLLYTVAQLAAGHGSIRAIIDDMGLLSTEAEGVGDAVPESARPLHVNAAGRVGALLGVRDPRRDSDAVPDAIEGMPLTDVRLVSIKLISLAELKLITERGGAGRKHLADRFCEAPDTAVVSALGRASVV